MPPSGMACQPGSKTPLAAYDALEADGEAHVSSLTQTIIGNKAAGTRRAGMLQPLYPSGPAVQQALLADAHLQVPSLRMGGYVQQQDQSRSASIATWHQSSSKVGSPGSPFSLNHPQGRLRREDCPKCQLCLTNAASQPKSTTIPYCHTTKCTSPARQPRGAPEGCRLHRLTRTKD